MSEPEDNLETLFAAEEAAIKDDGFTAQVMQDVRTTSRLRRPVIYGAGFIGAGFALGGLTKLAPYLHLDDWIGQARATLDASVGEAASAVGLRGSAGVPDVVLISAGAMIAAVSCFFAALSLQGR